MTSPAFTELRFQPTRESAEGLPLSAAHVVTLPRPSFTSNHTTECGFAQTSFVAIAFFSVIVVASYAAVEWCACAIEPKANTNITKAMTDENLSDTACGLFCHGHRPQRHRDTEQLILSVPLCLCGPWETLHRIIVCRPAAPSTSARSKRSGRRCSATAIACSAPPSTRKMPCRRRSSGRGSTRIASKSAPRCGRGCIASPPTSASTRCPHDRRRARPVEDGPLKTINDPLETLPRTHWLEPVPDARALPADANPHELAVLRQSIRLAFVAAVQHLPPRQRAVLLLMEVLGWSAAETAECLEMTTAAVNSAIQRARATLAQRNVSLQPSEEELSEDESDLLNRYVDAFHLYDVDALVSLLREDATMSMPPFAFWLQGPESIKGVAARPRLGVPRLPAAADRGVRHAGVRAVSPPARRVVRRLGAHHPRAGGWQDCRLEHLPRRREALSLVRLADDAAARNQPMAPAPPSQAHP